MKIRNIIPAMQKKIQIYKYEKEKRFLDDYAHIDYKTLNKDVIDILEPTRLGLARHASANGMSIEISGANNIFRDIEQDCPTLIKAEEKNKDNLLITVTDLLFNRSKTAIVSGNPKFSEVHSVPDYFVIEHPQDGVQQTRLTSHDYDIDIRRNIYMKLDELIKSLQNRK